jgi:hypothetical protein
MPHAPSLTLTCPPVSQPMSIDTAHLAMQDHLRCETGTCVTRYEALDVLVRAGRVILASTR